MNSEISTAKNQLLARSVARELSVEEINQVSGGGDTLQYGHTYVMYPNGDVSIQLDQN